jgi:hypothetical protein
MLLGDFGPGCGQAIAGLDGRVTQPADLGLCRNSSLNETVGAALGFADCDSDAFADFARKPLDAVAQGGRALGERADRVVLAARLRSKRVELGTARELRFEEPVGTLVAVDW